MPDKKGFTILEIILALLILSILAAISVPIYTRYTIQAQAQAAENNLIAIYNGQQNHYYQENSYIAVGGIAPFSNGGASEATINAALGLNITDTNFTYSCACVGFVGPLCPSYTCTAKNATLPKSFTLTISSAEPAPTPIVLPGGTGCATIVGASCNPTCTFAVGSGYQIYCPTS